MKLPPLNTLRIFDAAARHLSFTKAAAELGMTQAAVSYQIKLLEDRVGAPLFRRMTRKLALTDSGAAFAPAVAEAFSRLQAAFAELNKESGGVLAITAVTTFTTNWLVPRIGRFQMAHPNIAVRLETATRLVDFMQEEFDVGIRSMRVANTKWPGLTSHHLGSIDVVPMGNPHLVQEAGVGGARDLLKLPLLGETYDGSGKPGDAGAVMWQDWFRQAGIELSEPPVMRASFATQQMLGRAAATRQGIALLTPAYFRQEVALGQLVELSPVRLTDIDNYYLVHADYRREVPKIKAFRDWLLAEAAADHAHH